MDTVAAVRGTELDTATEDDKEEGSVLRGGGPYEYVDAAAATAAAAAAAAEAAASLAAVDAAATTAVDKGAASAVVVLATTGAVIEGAVVTAGVAFVNNDVEDCAADGNESAGIPIAVAVPVLVELAVFGDGDG
jgi:hypothetical protein